MTQPPPPTEDGDGPQHAKPESAPVPPAAESSGPAHAADADAGNAADAGADDSSPSTDPNLRLSGFPPPGASYPPPGATYPPPGAVAPGGFPPPGPGYAPPSPGFPPPGRQRGAAGS